MKPRILLLAASLLAASFPVIAEDKPFDFNRAKELHEKSLRGEPLTADEKNYLEEAKQKFQERTGMSEEQINKLRALQEKSQRGETLTAEEQKMLDEARARAGQNSGSPAQPPTGSGDGFDWNKVKALHERVQNGEKLGDEDQKIYDEAKRRIQAGQGPGARPSSSGDGFDWQRARSLYDRKQKGETLSAEDQKFLDDALRRRGQGGGGGGGSRGERGAPVADANLLKELVPLTELTAAYKGQDGGLYGAGQNQPPAAQQELATKAVARIKPLNGEGKPDAGGKIVLMSLGMSNTTQEFSKFVRKANEDPRKAANVTVVDCAQGGKDATAWATADAPPWSVAESRLKAAGVTPQQVQVLWIKQALIAPQKDFPAETDRLRARLTETVRLARQKYPNLQIAFLSSRTYGGYATTRLNPEPHAYEGAFAMRGLIQEQMRGGADLNADPAKGAVQAPVLLWGPYLWAAGASPRKADAFAYALEDFGGDGTHPSPSGQEKVAGLLLEFFTKDANAQPWFAKQD